MSVVRIKTDAYADQIVTDTYNPGAGGDSRHEWFLVTSIAPGAFKNNKQLKYVYIPETVLTIPKDCFKGCSNLKEVEWGSYILKCAKNDETLKNSAFPKYNAKKRICQGAFANCKKLELIYLGPIYAEIKVEKKAFDKDKKTIKVSGKKNKYLKKFAQNIKDIGNAKKEAKAVKEKETY